MQQTAVALRNTQAALRTANSEVANQRRQKTQLLKYKVEAQKQAAHASRPTSALSGSRALSPTRSLGTVRLGQYWFRYMNYEEGPYELRAPVQFRVLILIPYW